MYPILEKKVIVNKNDNDNKYYYMNNIKNRADQSYLLLGKNALVATYNGVGACYLTLENNIVVNTHNNVRQSYIILDNDVLVNTNC